MTGQDKAFTVVDFIQEGLIEVAQFGHEAGTILEKVAARAGGTMINLAEAIVEGGHAPEGKKLLSGEIAFSTGLAGEGFGSSVSLLSGDLLGLAAFALFFARLAIFGHLASHSPRYTISVKSRRAFLSDVSIAMGLCVTTENDAESSEGNVDHGSGIPRSLGNANLVRRAPSCSFDPERGCVPVSAASTQDLMTAGGIAYSRASARSSRGQRPPCAVRRRPGRVSREGLCGADESDIPSRAPFDEQPSRALYHGS